MINPNVCSCCEEIWNRENLKNIPLGKHELHLCPDCYAEYIKPYNEILSGLEAHKWNKDEGSKAIYDSAIDDAVTYIEEYVIRDKHKDILPAIDKRYTLTIIFTPDKCQVLMVLHNKQHMLNFVGGHIEPGEDEMEASYRELFEETGITKDDIDLKFVQSEHCTASFANPEWYLYVTAGVLKHDVELKEEKNSLHWVFVTDDHVLLHDTFGNGNCFVFMQRALLALEDE